MINSASFDINSTTTIENRKNIFSDDKIEELVQRGLNKRLGALQQEK
ncbi:MAG TPA: hypothetical protein VLA74_10900 [Nitrososphaeraceae archaeon]|nr:hypothetical protein [Nitrososphaeraceae archaeon]